MRYYGSRGELPRRYETLSIQSFSHPTCNLEIFDIRMRSSGVIKNGTREGEFLANTEEVYYTLSAYALNAFGCGIYHKPNVEFNLLTSNCPDLAPDQAEEHAADEQHIRHRVKYLAEQRDLLILAREVAVHAVGYACGENDPQRCDGVFLVRRK